MTDEINEKKKEYLGHTKNSTRPVILRALKEIQKYEEISGKDFGTLDYDETIKAIQDMKINRFEKLYRLIYEFRDYQNWYFSMGWRIGVSPLTEASPKHLTEMCLHKREQKNTFINEKRLDSILSQLVNPRDKFTVLCLYEGIGGKGLKEIPMIRPRDIGENEIYIQNRDKHVKVSKRTIDMAKQCLETTHYQPTTLSGTYRKARKLIDNGTVIKAKTDSGIDKFVDTYNVSFHRALKATGIDIWPQDIERSGMVNYINEQAKLMHMSSKEYLKTGTARAMLNNKYDFDPEQFNRFLFTYGDYLE